MLFLPWEFFRRVGNACAECRKPGMSATWGKRRRIGPRAGPYAGAPLACAGTPKAAHSSSTKFTRAIGDRRRKRAGTACLRIEVNADQRADGDRFARTFLVHAVREVNCLVVYLEHLRHDFHGVAGEQFLPVVDGLFDRGHAPALLAQIGCRKAESRQERPRRLVELAGVPHHVHVAHVIAMPRINQAAIGDRLLTAHPPGFADERCDCCCTVTHGVHAPDSKQPLKIPSNASIDEKKTTFDKSPGGGTSTPDVGVAPLAMPR